MNNFNLVFAIVRSLLSYLSSSDHIIVVIIAGNWHRTSTVSFFVRSISSCDHVIAVSSEHYQFCFHVVSLMIIVIVSIFVPFPQLNISIVTYTVCIRSVSIII